MACFKRTLFVWVLAAGAISAAEPAQEAKTGLKVGQQAPAFRLRDQKGQPRSLAEFLKQGNVAVVFYRSASW